MTEQDLCKECQSEGSCQLLQFKKGEQVMFDAAMAASERIKNDPDANIEQLKADEAEINRLHDDFPAQQLASAAILECPNTDSL